MSRRVLTRGRLLQRVAVVRQLGQSLSCTAVPHLCCSASSRSLLFLLSEFCRIEVQTNTYVIQTDNQDAI